MRVPLQFFWLHAVQHYLWEGSSSCYGHLFHFNQGGAGYIGSHAVLILIEEGYKVTIVDNLSRGNGRALEILESVAQPHQLFSFIVDLADVHH
eukprot:gene3139-8214_t